MSFRFVFRPSFLVLKKPKLSYLFEGFFLKLYYKRPYTINNLSIIKDIDKINFDSEKAKLLSLFREIKSHKKPTPLILKSVASNSNYSWKLKEILLRFYIVITGCCAYSVFSDYVFEFSMVKLLFLFILKYTFQMNIFFSVSRPLYASYFK
jgi:hypothetical protein